MSASPSPARTPDLILGTLPPKNWSITAWAALAATSVIVTYLITLTLGLALTIFGALVAIAIPSHFSLIGILLSVFTLIVGVTILWSLVPRANKIKIDEVPINLSREPRLRQELESIALAMGERMPSEVYLIAIPNAAVMQLKGRRMMLLGLPLLQLLTVSQFRAVLAHEFGHYYGGDTRLGPWVFRARDNMAKVLTNLTRESEVLSLLRRWAVIGVLHMIIIGGLVLYWKLLSRLTQYISRRQEFRCDELACYVAGSASLDGGLRNLNRATLGFAAYWKQVALATANGIRTPLADGFGRFMNAPAIATAVSTAMEERLASDKTGVWDSHPPLNARLRKIQNLAIPATHEDARPAITLLNDLASLELGLLQKLAPGANLAAMKIADWETAGSTLYVPVWRKQTELLRKLLGPCTLNALPEKVRELPQIANRIPDPKGRLLTREERSANAANSLALVLAMALVDNGWRLNFQPGEFYLERNEERLDPAQVIANLKSGGMTDEAWQEYCAKQEIGDRQLVVASETN